MFCPKCGVENPDVARVCGKCGWAMPDVSGGTGQARTSRLAVASLVLALLSFCTFFVTAPIALILGIIAIVMIARSKGHLRGMGMAIAGVAVPVVVLPLFAVLMGILMPALARARDVAQRMTCGQNMAALSDAMISYVDAHGNTLPPPEEWCAALMKQEPALSRKSFQCAGDKQGPSSYAMNSNVRKTDTQLPPDMVLLFESPPGWNQSGGPELLTTEHHRGEGCNIMYCDGHVAFVRTDDIETLKWTPERAKGEQ